MSDKEDTLLGPIKFGKITSAKLPGSEDVFYSKLSDDRNSAIKNNLQKVYESRNGKVGSKQIFEESDNMTLYEALKIAEPVYNIANLAQLYDTNPFHASAVDAKTDSVVGLGYNFEYSSKVLKQLEKLAKKDDEGERKRKLELKLDDARDKFSERIDNMNGADEFSEILEKVYKDRLIMGNAYIEIGRTADGNIGYIGHVSPINIRVRTGRDGFVQMVKGKTIFFRNYGDRKTRDPINGDSNPNELIHIRQYSPIDDYYGLPEITASIPAIAGMKFAMQYNMDYFENKAVPRYIIKAKGLNLDSAQQKNLLEFFETTIKGVSHRTVFIPVPGGSDKDIEFDPVETGHQDGHFQEYIKDMTQMILSRHRVPQARIGLSAAATSAAESRESEKTFKETVCQPEQRILEKKLNRLFAEMTDLFVFKLTEYALSDEDTQSQIYERGIRNGWYVPDEIRTWLGLGPRPDGKGSEAVDMRSLQDLAGEQAEAQAKQATTTQLAQAKAEAKAQTYNTRTRDQNRQSDNPDKNPNNRNGRRSPGEGRHPNK